MYKEILNKKQVELLPLLYHFSENHFYLAGETSLALQLGHRESVDLDLFTFEEFDNLNILKSINKIYPTSKINVLIDVLDEYTCILNSVKVTFLRYPFVVKDINKLDNINLANELTIGAMKAYALGRRSKWKDYVDLYILLQKYSIKDICNKAKEIFGTVFSEKLFLQQLSYFKDIDYTEKIIWKKVDIPSNTKIEDFLKNISIDALV